MGPKLTFQNTIIWGNQPVAGPGLQGIIMNSIGEVTMDHCCIEMYDESIPANAMVAFNPQVIDANGADDILGTPDDDLRLASTSPCIDVGDSALTPSQSEVDLDVFARVTDGNRDSIVQVDIGCYEFQPPATAGDRDASGVLDGADLGMLLAAWGPCPVG